MTPRRFTPLALTAIALWTVLLVVLIVLRAFHPEKGSVLPTYEMAGHQWLHGERIYTVKGGFVYSPLVAAFFAPFSMLPASLSAILWLLLNTGLYLGAVAWWLRLDLHRIGQSSQAAIFLLLLPLTIGNLHNGQINPADIALIMFAILGARTGRWNLSALCIAAATYAKIYPLAAGLLLIVIYPRQLGWRIAVALLLLGGLSLVLQRPAYALDQYHQWFATRTTDNRHAYDEKMMPRDLWRVLLFLRIPITERLYWCLRLATAGALALLCFIAPRRGWPLDRLLVALADVHASFVAASSSAPPPARHDVSGSPAQPPAALLAFFQPGESSGSKRLPAGLQWTVVAAYTILLTGLAINSFTKIHRLPATMIIQPIAALVFLVFSLVWVFDKSFWAADPKTPASASSL